MFLGRKIGRSFSGFGVRYRGPLVVLGLLSMLGLAVGVRQLNFPYEFVLYSYLQIAGALLAFTFAAHALLRFRGMHDRLTLILAFGFALTGLIETSAVFWFYKGTSGQIAGVEIGHTPLVWMVGRTLLALLLLSALWIERRLPHSRAPGREVCMTLGVVSMAAYLIGTAYWSAPLEPAFYPQAWLARPWDLVPAALFLVAAVGFGRREPLAGKWAFDGALTGALWLNVACHLVATQSTQFFDAPFTLAQLLKVASYGLLVGGILLDNLRLFDQARRLAVSDCVTGLGNYRALLHVLEVEIQRSRRTGRSFSLLLMDLDDLKKVNDEHGHLAGTRALCRLGNVLRLNCRSLDTAARYGGDEFALVLPEAGAQAAEHVGRRIRERLAADGETPAITVSLGTAVFPDDGETVEALLESADRALYAMKRRRSSPMLDLARIAACF